MEEHLWTSSFWRLLSNCSDSRKLLIVKKIILHKLGHGPEINNDLCMIVNNKTASLPKDKQKVKAISTNKNKQEHLVNQPNPNTAVKVQKAPIMGTAALLTKYKNCTESEDSKIVTNLIRTRFNKETPISDDSIENTNGFGLLKPSIETVRNSTPIIFDEKQFLEDALGDEINSFTGSDMECPGEETDSTHEADQDTSISSSRLSSLLSRASTLYSSLRRRVHQQKGLRNAEPKPSIHPIANTEIDLLLQESSIQNQIVIEVCKALSVCLSSKEFLFGPEHIEAERILLIAVYKQSIVLKQIKQMKYGTEKSNVSCGSAVISNLYFPISTPTQKEGYTNWFMVIVRCGATVLATNAVTADHDNKVQFQEKFEFNGLNHDFEIDISIYSLLAKSNAKKYSHESKYRLKSEETVTCLGTPEKLLCRRNSIQQTKQYCFEHREPSFKLWGKTTINIGDVDRSSPFCLEQIPNGATLKGYALMDFNTTVEFEENYSGFLTIRTECDKCMAWNHRWCNLKGHTLFYWNYPADQDVVEPIGKINLQQCITSEISNVDRNLCARPRTLLVETAEPTSQGTLYLRHFLSADTTEKMTIWKNRLNAVLTELIKWNLMKCKVQIM